MAMAHRLLGVLDYSPHATRVAGASWRRCLRLAQVLDSLGVMGKQDPNAGRTLTCTSV